MWRRGSTLRVTQSGSSGERTRRTPTFPSMATPPPPLHPTPA
ncbi:unnamed protein product, partial [Ectocarpus sp. 8 AP-2014]